MSRIANALVNVLVSTGLAESPMRIAQDELDGMSDQIARIRDVVDKARRVDVRPGFVAAPVGPGIDGLMLAINGWRIELHLQLEQKATEARELSTRLDELRRNIRSIEVLVEKAALHKSLYVDALAKLKLARAEIAALRRASPATSQSVPSAATDHSEGERLLREAEAAALQRAVR